MTQPLKKSAKGKIEPKQKKVSHAKPKSVLAKKGTESPQKSPAQKKNGYYAIGRRKESVARVYYFISPTLEVLINNKDLKESFNHILFKQIINSPFEVSAWNKGKWVIRVSGGGKRGQAESIRLGIARLISSMQPELRTTLKKAGLLTRDPRVKERKKYGLKRARRAPQWQKR